ncbi:hypothetical protein DFQ26_009320 [Actinomortierella ambigua]|nr:hypothetical protein DFQ26_009320 [Actinomortierella ambigua]
MFGGNFDRQVRYARCRLDALMHDQEYIVHLLNKLPITDAELQLDPYDVLEDTEADSESLSASVSSRCSDFTTSSVEDAFPYSVFREPKVESLCVTAWTDAPRLKAQQAYQEAIIALWESYHELCHWLRQFIIVSEENAQDLEYMLGIHDPGLFPPKTGGPYDATDGSDYSPLTTAVANSASHLQRPKQQQDDERCQRNHTLSPASLDGHDVLGIRSSAFNNDPERLWSTTIIDHLDAVSRCSDTTDAEGNQIRSAWASSPFGGGREPYLGPFRPPTPEPCIVSPDAFNMAPTSQPLGHSGILSLTTPQTEETPVMAHVRISSSSTPSALRAEGDGASCYSAAEPSSARLSSELVMPEATTILAEYRAVFE